MSQTYTLNEAQLKGLMMASAAHAPTAEAAEKIVDKVLADFKEPGTIIHNLVDGLGDQ